MKFIKNNFGVAIFTIIILILILSRTCNCGKETITVKTDTVFVKVKQDTAFIPIIRIKYLPGKAPKVFEKWDTLYLELLAEVDTAAILKEFYSFNIYSDTLKNDYGFTIVNDTVSTNKILGRGFKNEFVIPEVTKTVTITKFKKAKKWGVGLQVGYGVNNKPYFGVGVSRNIIRF